MAQPVRVLKNLSSQGRAEQGKLAGPEWMAQEFYDGSTETAALAQLQLESEAGGAGHSSWWGSRQFAACLR